MTFPDLLLVVAVGLAGSTGALTRYLLSRFFAERISPNFPFGTLFINISGAFLIGLLFSLAARAVISTNIQLILATGFMGGYTTFSTMSWEGVQLARGGRLGSSLFYLGGNVVPGLLVAALGLWLGWRI